MPEFILVALYKLFNIYLLSKLMLDECELSSNSANYKETSTRQRIIARPCFLSIMGSFGELRISQQEVIQGAKFCQSTNDLAVSSVPRVV